MEILSLGEKIRRKRKSLRLTLKDVAGDNVTPAQLSYVESNKCKPSSNLLKYICSKIELDVEYALESECEQASKYCDYYLREYEFYVKRGELKEALNKLLEIERIAQEYRLDRYLGIVSYNKGVGFIEKKDYDSAQNTLLVALQIFMKFNDEGYIYNCYRNLGIVALKKNHLSDALEFYKRSLEIGNNNDENNMINYCIMFDIARIYHRIGNRDEAGRYLTKVIEGMSNLTRSMQNSQLLREIAALSAEVFPCSRFNKYIDEFFDFCKDQNLENDIFTLNLIKAMAHIKEHEYKTGMELIYRAFEQSGDKIDEFQINYVLKIALVLLKDKSEYTEIVLSKIPNAAMNNEQNRAALFLESQVTKDIDIEKAIELLIKAESIDDDSKTKCLSILINNELGELYRKDKKYQESIKYLLKSAQLSSISDTADYEFYSI